MMPNRLSWSVFGPLLIVAIFVAVVLGQRASMAANRFLGTEMERPVLAESLYLDLQKCTGLTPSVPLDNIKWRATPTYQPSVLAEGSSRTIGAWVPRFGTIYIVEWLKDDSYVIKHELGHALISPQKGHPSHVFSVKCGIPYRDH